MENEKGKWSPESAGAIAVACTMVKGLKASIENAQGYWEMFPALAALGVGVIPFPSFLSHDHIVRPGSALLFPPGS